MLHSLYFRLLSLVVMIVVGTVVVLSFYGLRGFVDASVFQLEHEVTLLSDTVKASIIPALAGEPDLEAIQSQVDRIAMARERNDIEINILLLEGSRTSIVASNIPDNLGKPSIYEHRDTLTALKGDQTISFIGRDDNSSHESAKPPGHPDHYIAPGHRFISVTRPLTVEGKGYGAINTKISLFEIDRRLGEIRQGVLLVGILIPFFAVLLMGIAVRRGLQPLNRLGLDVARIEAATLDRRLDTRRFPKELLPIAGRLNELLERLETSFQRERRFSADAAHELRTPLATLKTIAQVGLQESERENGMSDPTEFLRDTLEVTEQMERLVENLLAMVRCETNQMDIKWEECDLGSMTREAWEIFLSKAELKGIASDFRTNGVAPVATDRLLAKGMLTNLISNSVQYTEPRGRIFCSVEPAEDSVVFVIANSHNGLCEEDLEHLREPFWRKDESRTGSQHCGIGLSVVSSYARVLGVAFEMALKEDGMFSATLRFPRDRPTRA